MAETLLTNFVNVTDGDTTQINLLEATEIVSARIRWKGIDATKTYTTTSWETREYTTQGTGTMIIIKGFPSVPDPPSTGRRAMARVSAVESGEQVKGHVSIVGTNGTSDSASRTQNTFTDSFSTSYVSQGDVKADDEWTEAHGTCQNVEVDGAGNAELMLRVGASYEKTSTYVASTQNPSTTIHGETTSGPFSLNDGEISDWYSLYWLQVEAINDIAHSIGGSNEAEYQIEVVYKTWSLSAPTVHDPADGLETVDRQEKADPSFWFDMTLVEDAGSEATKYHARVILGALTMESKEGTGTWQYWDGTTWQSFPTAEGVDPDTRVRVKADLLPLGEYAWRAATYDGDYGDEVTRNITILRLSAPAIIEPERNERIEERLPWYVFDVADDEYQETPKYHARFRLSKYVSMSPLVLDYDSDAGTGTWQYWDGAAWQPFPADGVDPGTRVRVQPDIMLDYTIYYWTAATHDGNDWSKEFYPAKTYIVIAVDVMYALYIEGVAWLAYSLGVSEASNGEMGGIAFSVNNKDGGAHADIDYGDVVDLVVRDKRGNEEDFRGLVRQKNPAGDVLTVQAITGDGILAERRIKEDYGSQDIGLTVKAIIDTYCAPLTSNNVDTSIGYSRAVDADDQKPIEVLEHLRREYGLYYFVDDDWDLHFYAEDAIASALVDIRYGDA